MKFPKDHPYMIRLDEALKQYYVCKVIDANGAEHGEDYTQMKEEILNAMFHPPEDIRQKEVFRCCKLCLVRQQQSPPQVFYSMTGVEDGKERKERLEKHEKEKKYDFSEQKYSSTPQHVKIPTDDE